MQRKLRVRANTSQRTLRFLLVRLARNSLRFAGHPCTRCNTVSEIGGPSVPCRDGSPRHSLRCIDPWQSRLESKRGTHGYLKRVGLFFLRRPTTWNRREVRSNHIMAYTDIDWAADREDLRLRSGGMLVHRPFHQGFAFAKHVHTRYLWLQTTRDKNRKNMAKIGTDIRTKPGPIQSHPGALQACGSRV